MVFPTVKTLVLEFYAITFSQPQTLYLINELDIIKLINPIKIQSVSSRNETRGKKQKLITNLIIYGKAIWSWPTAKTKKIFLFLRQIHTKIFGTVSLKFRNLLLLFIFAFKVCGILIMLVHINILSILLNIKAEL